MDDRAEVEAPKGPNGSDPNPRCTWNERRLNTIEQYSHETRGALSAVSSGVESLREWADGFETRWLKEFGRLSRLVEDNQGALKVLVGQRQPPTPEQILNAQTPPPTPEQIRNVLPSLDYGEGDDTAVQERPQIVGRMKVAERAAVSLEAENAALKATIEERNRQSERARADADEAAKRAEEKERQAIALAEAAKQNALKANELAVAKWKIIAGTIVVVVGALVTIFKGIVPLLEHIFGG